jgi:diguanylate cyclase (GGDEF)-like protein
MSEDANTAVAGSAGTPVDSATDIAELRAENARLKASLAAASARITELEFRADIDALTGVRNRHGFERELKRSLAYVTRYGTPAVLMYLDFDDFKAINDHHGHGAGDTVLRNVTALLLQNVRASDVVGRLGGDEFAILMWNLDVPLAEAKARRLEAVISQARIDYMGADGVAIGLTVGVSTGVAALEAGVSFSQVLDAADRAMYAQKRGRKLARSVR